MAWHVTSPGLLRADGDANARPPRNRKVPGNAGGLDGQLAPATREIEPILRERNTERLGEIARPATEPVQLERRRPLPRAPRPPSPHHLDALERLQSPNQH